MDWLDEITSSRAYDVSNRLVRSVGKQFGYFEEKIYQNDPSLTKTLKETRDFRVSKLSAKKFSLLDQIKIHYDDNTEWSYGPDCGDDDPRVLVMAEGEYLIRCTHETLIDHESAGAAVEFETNKGRVVKFAPYEDESICLGRDEDKKTVIADEGYEIVCLKIDRGELKGSEQQPVPEEELKQQRPQSWYAIVYYAEKEENDLENELLLEGITPSLPPGKKVKVENPEGDKIDDLPGGGVPSDSESGGDRSNDEATVETVSDTPLNASSNSNMVADRQISQSSTSLRQRKINTTSSTNGNETCDSNMNISNQIDKEEGLLKEPEEQSDDTSPPDEHSDDSSQLDESSGDSDDPIEDDDLDYYFFSNQLQAKKAWMNVKELTRQKQGRGALLIDCLKSNVVRKTGDHKTVDHCRDSAVRRGLCLPVNEDTFDVFELCTTLYQGVTVKTEFLMFFVSIFVMTLNLTAGAHRTLLEGQIMTAIATDPNATDWRRRNMIEQFLCDTFLHCNGSYISLCQSLLLYYLFVRIALILFNMLIDSINTLLAGTKLAAMGRDLFIHTLSLDMRFFEETRNLTDYMNVSALHDLLFSTIPDIITSVVRYFIVCYYLISMDFYLGVSSILFTTFANIYIARFFMKRDIISYKQQAQLTRRQDQIQGDIFGMLSTVKTFAKEKYHEKEYNKWFDSSLKNMKRNMASEYFRSFLSQIIYICEYICIVYFGYIRYCGGNGMTSSEFIGFTILYDQLDSLFADIKGSLTFIGRSFHDVKRCNALWATKSRMKNGKKKMENVKGEIIFKDVKFKYPSRPKDQVLKGLNLTIKPNQTTAIVGHSGAGKSTMAKLITRIYDPTSGSITVDGKDLRSLDLEYYRSKLAVVDQFPSLFNRQLFDNIAYGKVDSDQCTLEEVEAAGKLANCDFISKFREGYQTFAGYCGHELSGGQLQRVAIARAAIRDPKILVLDEATSSLDAENEKEVQVALEKLMKGRTVIVIAHRLSTIRNADNIVCMKDGNVVEQGTHDELIEKKGAYYNLISQQIMQEKKECQKCGEWIDDGNDYPEEHPEEENPENESGENPVVENEGLEKDDDQNRKSDSAENIVNIDLPKLKDGRKSKLNMMQKLRRRITRSKSMKKSRQANAEDVQ